MLAVSRHVFKSDKARLASLSVYFLLVEEAECFDELKPYFKQF